MHPLKRQRSGVMAILSGWKEIAKYLGRGVRTVQRWEGLGLPVHRPHGSPRSAVSAVTGELDDWLARTPVHLVDVVTELRNEISALRAKVAQLEARDERQKAKAAN